jgi:uncharacterized protein YecE (DUF72 family)
MQFGRVQEISGIDFSLPPLSARSRQLLARAAHADGGAALQAEWLRLGAPAFRHRDWLGTLYPVKSNSDDWLSIYASKVSALELNSTFYGLPSEATLERWISQTPERFRFCPKVPRTISHELSSPELQARVTAFAERMLRLGNRLGPGLLQLPERVTPEQLPQLEAALATFPEDFALAVEVRHPAWFEGGAVLDALLDALEPRGLGLVITDVSGRRDASHASISCPYTFVRFVGEGGDATDTTRVQAWIARLAEWHSIGLSSVFFFVHQPDDILAPQLLAVASEHAQCAGICLPSCTLERGPTVQLDLFR